MFFQIPIVFCNNFETKFMATIKLFLKNLLISLMTAGLMYQVGINDYIDFPKNYPNDYMILALSIAFCSFLLTYNQQNHDRKIQESEELGS